MPSSSTSSSTLTTLTHATTFTSRSFWYQAERVVCGIVWMSLHLKTGELMPEVVEPSNLYGQAAVQSQSASTWSWKQITAGQNVSLGGSSGTSSPR